jgi:hypothetical protein
MEVPPPPTGPAPAQGDARGRCVASGGGRGVDAHGHRACACRRSDRNAALPPTDSAACRERTVKFTLLPIESAPSGRARGLTAHDISAAMPASAFRSYLSANLPIDLTRASKFGPGRRAQGFDVSGVRAGVWDKNCDALDEPARGVDGLARTFGRDVRTRAGVIIGNGFEIVGGAKEGADRRRARRPSPAD